MDGDETLISDLNDVQDGLGTDGDWEFAQIVVRAKERLHQLTRPLTLDECRDALNANKYSFVDDWSDESPWELDGEGLFDGGTILTHFEAQCLARGFLARGGAK